MRFWRVSKTGSGQLSHRAPLSHSLRAVWQRRAGGSRHRGAVPRRRAFGGRYRRDGVCKRRRYAPLLVWLSGTCLSSASAMNRCVQRMVRAGRQPLYNAWHVQRLHSVVVSAWPPLPVRSEGVVCLTPLHQSKRAPHRLAPSMRAGEEACDMFGAPAMSFSPGVLTPAATHTELSAEMLTMRCHTRFAPLDEDGGNASPCCTRMEAVDPAYRKLCASGPILRT